MLSCSMMRGSIRSLFESSTLHYLRKYCHGRMSPATLFKSYQLPPAKKLEMKPNILAAFANAEFFTRSCQGHVSRFPKVLKPELLCTEQTLLKQDDEQLNFTLEEWKKTCLRQSIFDAIVGIFKLIGSLLMAVIRALVSLVKMLMSSKTREKAAQFKQQASEKMSPHFQKGKDTMEREIPKLKSKLEEGLPAAKKNIDNFNSRVQDELKDAKTYGEKQDRFFNVLGDYVKSSKALQVFLIIIFVYFLWNFLKTLFRIVFPKRGKASCDLEQVA